MAEFYCSPQIFSGFIVLILVWIFLSVFSSVSLSQEFSPPPSLCHFLHTQTLWGRTSGGWREGKCRGVDGIAGYLKPATSGFLKWRTQCWESIGNAAAGPRFWTVASLEEQDDGLQEDLYQCVLRLQTRICGDASFILKKYDSRELYKIIWDRMFGGNWELGLLTCCSKQLSP